MSRILRNLVVIALCLLLLAGGGADGNPNACTVAVAHAALTGEQAFGLFYAYIFNIPGKTGTMGAQLAKWFEAGKVFSGGKSKKSTKLGFKTYKGELQAEQNTKIAFPKKAPKDKRATISAFLDFGSGRFVSDRRGEGVFDARVSVAINDSKGLSSDESSSYLQMNRPLTQFGSDSTSIVATYMEGKGGEFLGFEVQAFEDFNDPIDEPQLIEGTAELDLRIQQTETQLITMVRPTPPGGPSADSLGDDWVTISIQDIPVPDLTFSLELGARTLFKKGTFFFDFFAIGEIVPGPELESEIFTDLIGAILDLGEARDALTQEAPDLEAAEDALNDARETLATAQTELTEAMDEETLHESTEGKTAAKVIKRAIKGADRLIKKLATGKAKKPEKLAKPTQKVIDDTAVIMANLSGLKTRSGKQLNFVPPGGG
jgi:hypothetical protein